MKNNACSVEPENNDLWWKITPKGSPPLFFNMAEVPARYQDRVDPLTIGRQAIGKSMLSSSTKAEFQGAARPDKIHRLKSVAILCDNGTPDKFEIPLYYRGFI